MNYKLSWNPIKIQKRIELLKKTLSDEGRKLEITAGMISTTGEARLAHENKPIEDELVILENRKTFVFQILGIAIPLVAVFSTLILSFLDNQRNNRDFELRNRPYLVISDFDVGKDQGGSIGTYVIHIKNVGTLPAKLGESTLSCGSHGELATLNTTTSNLVGSGEQLLTSFNISTSSPVSCKYSFFYDAPVLLLSNNKPYETRYSFRIEANKSVIPLDADLK